MEEVPELAELDAALLDDDASDEVVDDDLPASAVADPLLLPSLLAFAVPPSDELLAVLFLEP